MDIPYHSIVQLQKGLQIVILTCWNSISPVRNVEEGGLSFGTDPHVVERVVKAVRNYVKQPLIVKLSPEVTDITEIARAVVSGGADALS